MREWGVGVERNTPFESELCGRRIILPVERWPEKKQLYIEPEEKQPPNKQLLLLRGKGNQSGSTKCIHN